MRTEALPTLAMDSRDLEATPGIAVADPRWARPALVTLIVGTAVSWIVGLDRNGWANDFYSAAVQAGTRSWKAFLFGSFDAANSITVDKPPASLWPMELAGRVFGVNSWSIQLPQVILGLGSVALLYAIVKRHFGPAAGLIAGVVLALTPVATLMFCFNNPDALLIFLMVAAVWAMMRAVEDGRTRWLLLCGAFIGLGFLTKQLQVMLVVPGLAMTYLVSGPVGIGRRLAQLVAALAAMLLSAGWWVLIVTLTPSSDRPYVGGSTDNSFLNLTFGYNGFGRLTGSEGGPMGAVRPDDAGPPTGGQPSLLDGKTGLSRLFTGESGGQISWLLPAALIFLVVGLLLCGRSRRTDPHRALYVIWGGWLVCTAAVFSYMSGIFHDYYTVALAPAVAALIGIGAVHLWQGRRSVKVILALAVTVALTAVWAWILLGRSPGFVPALRWVILTVGLLAAGVLMLARPGARGTTGPHTLMRWAGLIAFAAAIAGPLAYCIQTVTTTHTSGIVTAGPTVKGSLNGFPGLSAAGAVTPGGSRSLAPPGLGDTTVSARISAILSDDAGSYTWVAAIDGAMSAAPYQLATFHPVMPIGGFSTGDPSPTLGQFRSDVAAHRIHYYIDENRGPFGMTPQNADDATAQPTEAKEISDWVKAHYTSITEDGIALYDLTTATG